MASLPPTTRDALRRDARSVSLAMRSGVTIGRSTMALTYERRWLSFCQQFELDPHLASQPDPVAWLQVFACNVRDGRFSASQRPVRSSTVAEALFFVAQTFSNLGLPDPRHVPFTDRIDPRLSRLLKSYAKTDPCPIRVKPLPVPLLHRASDLALLTNTPDSLAAADLLWLAFFFLLRPGEYSGSSSESHPFRLSAVQLWAADVSVDPFTSPANLLLSCTFVALTFDTQKNGTRAEQIGHGRTDHAFACPVRCVARRLLYLRSLSAPPSTYLCAIGPSFRSLPTSTITHLLRDACVALGNPYGLHPSSITARSLRASGATALLNRHVDSDTIRLLGRWHSDAMLRYLHLQAHAVMQQFSTLMLLGGDYSLIPSVPHTPLHLLTP